MSEAPDFSGVATPPPKTNHLQMLADMADHLRGLQQAVVDAEAELERRQAELNEYQLRVIPEAMELAGVADVGLADGSRLTIKEDVKASISKENAPYALAWLRDHGHGGVIKEALLMDVRSLEPDERRLLEQAASQVGIDPEQVASVHPQTLKALVRELLEEGVTLPPSISVFQFKRAELKAPKTGKGK